MSTGIYKIKNLVNGKCYIGQSVNIQKRWYEHRYKAFSNGDISFNSPIHLAFRKYGLDNFEFSILLECNIDELDEKEKSLILEHNTLFPNGYNIMVGGQSSRREQTFCLDCGIVIHKDATRCQECNYLSKRICERPSKENLAEAIYLSNFSEVGRQFGVTDNTIRNWCRAYGLPTHSKDIEEWWRNHAGIEKSQPKKKNKWGKIAKIDKNTLEIIEVFENGQDVERKNPEYKAKTVNRACTGNLKTAYGFIWKRLEDINK